MVEELAECDYCLRTGRKKNLARMIDGYDVHMGKKSRGIIALRAFGSWRMTC